jgi:hypothetical protein
VDVGDLPSRRDVPYGVAHTARLAWVLLVGCASVPPQPAARRASAVAVPPAASVSATPDAPPPRRSPAPATYRLALDIDLTHGCSQSSESRSSSAVLVLTVDGRGGATLDVDVTSRSIEGPSLGAFRAGQRGFFTISSKRHATWRGRVEALGDGFDAHFDAVHAADVRWQGDGEADLPPMTLRAAALELECRRGLIEGYGPKAGAAAADTAGETPARLAVLLCRSSEPLFELDWESAQVDGAMPIAAVPGLQLFARTFFYDHHRVWRWAAAGR